MQNYEIKPIIDIKMTAATCRGCYGRVLSAEEACQASGNLYHTACFQCSSCGRTLNGKAFYNVNENIYCEEDYNLSGFQEEAFRCKVCDDVIRDVVLHAAGSYYHPGCLKCCICEEWLSDAQFTVGPDNEIYCIADYHKVYAPKCFSCKNSILPVDGLSETVKVVAMDRYFHVDCYHCEICGMQLTDEPDKRCYPLLDHLLCHNCHLQRIKSSKKSTSVESGAVKTDSKSDDRADRLIISSNAETSTNVVYTPNIHGRNNFLSTDEKYQNTPYVKWGSTNVTTGDFTSNASKLFHPAVSQNVVVSPGASSFPLQNPMTPSESQSVNSIQTNREQSLTKYDLVNPLHLGTTTITSSGIHSTPVYRSQAVDDKRIYSGAASSRTNVTRDNFFAMLTSGANKYSTSSLTRRGDSVRVIAATIPSPESSVKPNSFFQTMPRQERAMNYSTTSLERRNATNTTKLSTFHPFAERRFVSPETRTFPSPGSPTLQKQPISSVGYSTLSLGRRRRRPEENELSALPRAYDLTDHASFMTINNQL